MNPENAIWKPHTAILSKRHRELCLSNIVLLIYSPDECNVVLYHNFPEKTHTVDKLIFCLFPWERLSCTPCSMSFVLLSYAVHPCCSLLMFTHLRIVYHKFATQGSLFTCAEFVNDKIIKCNARQMRSIWILELLYHKLDTH